jgi:hypothetical protein
VPAEIEPPELARLVDFAEHPHTDDWSLRGALVRYAQPQPQRVNDLLDLVRRTQWALDRHSAVLHRDGDVLWALFESGSPPSDPEHARILGLLGVAAELDRIGAVLAGWAVDISGEPPDAAVDATIAEVDERLDALGVPREERTPPRGRGQ